MHTYTRTSKMVNLISDISIYARDEYNLDLVNKDIKLRKNNRTRSIHSSLAIENNSLGVDEVKDIINGKKIVGPITDITEVKNANNAYNNIENYDPYSKDDLLLAHKIMMDTILTNAGEIRNHGEAIYENEDPIFIAPSPEKVSAMLDDLLLWCKTTTEHPLITSSIFHYEFEYIHPFSDGNGRIGRLWQTVMLNKWNSIFEWIPIESMIHKHQSEYYEAINTANKEGDSTIFIEYILRIIKKAFLELKDNASLAPEDAIIRLLGREPGLNMPTIASRIDKSETTAKRYLSKLKSEDRIQYIGSPKKGGYYLCEERENQYY